MRWEHESGLRAAFVRLRGESMPPFVTQAAFWVFVIAVILTLIFLWGIDVTGN